MSGGQGRTPAPKSQVAAHTAGPWTVEADTTVTGESGAFVADCHDGESMVGTAAEYANARLIAAAPELLAALEQIQGLTDSFTILGIARAALSRCKP